MALIGEAGAICPPGQVWEGGRQPGAGCRSLIPAVASAAPPSTSPLDHPLARFVIPAAVLLMVDRERHPIVWTLFGAIPAGFAVVNLIARRKEL